MFYCRRLFSTATALKDFDIYKQANVLRIASYAPDTIILTNGIKVTPPFLLSDNFAFKYKVKQHNYAGLIDFISLLKNRPGICVIGTGKRLEILPKEILLGLKEMDVQVEVSDTKQACFAYNVLAQESRGVVGLFMPESFQ